MMRVILAFLVVSFFAVQTKAQENSSNQGNELNKNGKVIDEALVENFSNAVVFGEVEKVKEMIAERPELVNAQDDYGFSALHNVMCEEQAEIISMLIANGADVNLKNEEGISALHLACYAENAKLLLDAGADINQADNVGNAPLHTHAANGEESEEVVEYLILKGADKKVKNSAGSTALDVAVKREDAVLIQLLR